MLRTISFVATLMLSVFLFSFQSFAQQPTATLSGTQTVCASVPANLTVTFTGTGPWNFSYSDGTITTIITATQSPYTIAVNPTITTTYTPISVSGTNGGGTVSGSSIVTVISLTNNSSALIPVTISGPNPINCAAGITTLTAEAGHQYYRWVSITQSSATLLSGENASILNVSKYGAGNYEVIVFEKNCLSTNSILTTLTATDPFPKPIITGNNTIQCGSSNTILTATTGFARYDWMLNNNIVQSGLSNTLNATVIGDYTVTVYNALGCVNTSDKFTVASAQLEISPSLPPISISIPGYEYSRCIGGNNILTSPLGFVNYIWKKDGTIIQNGNLNTVNANTYGNGNYSVTAYDASGCFNTSSDYPVNMLSPSDTPTLTAYPYAAVCPGQPVTITYTTPRFYANYLWNDGSTQPTLKTEKGGTYTVILTDVSGCQHTASIVITQPPSGIYTINPVGSTKVCQQDKNTIVTMKSSISDNRYFYDIYKNGTLASSNDNVTQSLDGTITIKQSGSYTFLPHADPTISGAVCYTLSNPIDVTINILPIVESNTPCGMPSIYTHTARGASGSQLYKWYTSESVTTASYISTSAIDNSFLTSSSSAFVSIYDPIAQCETGKVGSYQSYDPIKLSDGLTVTTCVNIPVSASVYRAPNALGVYSWYTSPTGGSPAYVSPNDVNANTYLTPPLTANTTYYVDYVSPQGCVTTSRATAKVIVIQPPTVTYYANPVCSGSQAIAYAANTLDQGSYSWYDSPTSTSPFNSGFGQSVYSQSNFTADKTVYVDYTMGGCKTAKIPVSFTVIPAPTASFTITPLCDQTAILNYTGTCLPNATFNWFFGGMGTATILSGSGVGPIKVRWETPGERTLSLQVTNPNGCSSSFNKVYSVYSSPGAMSFNMNQSSFCQSNIAIELSAYPLGGIYSGSGVNGYYFTPSTVGPNQVTYSITGFDNCVYTTSTTLTVNPIPIQEVSITGVLPSYCYTQDYVYAIKGNPAGGVFNSQIIEGVTFSDGSASIRPIFVGNQTINYTYYNEYGCSKSAKQTTFINPLPYVDIEGLAASYCESEIAITITGEPAGGLLTGTNVSGMTYIPKGIGTRNISYTYKDTNNCSNTVTKSVTVYPIPITTFVGLNNSYCLNALPVKLMPWPAGGTFSGIGVTGDTFTPNTLGIKTITYTYKENGCVATSIQNTNVTPLLTPSFTISASAATPGCGQNVTFTATSSNGGTTPQYQWMINSIPVAGAVGSTYTTNTLNVVDVISCSMSSSQPCYSTVPVASNNLNIQVAATSDPYCLSFDGNSDLVQMPARAAYNIGSNDFTIEAEISINPAATAVMPILSRRTITNTIADGFLFYENNGQLLLQLSNVNYYSDRYGSIRDNFLHKIAVTRRSGAITFYLDGIVIGTASSYNSMNSSAPLRMGKDAYDGMYFYGTLANVHLWSVAKNSNELYATNIDPSATGLLGNWKMNECTGQGIQDFSGQANHGTLGTTMAAENADPQHSIRNFSYAMRSAVNFASSSNNAKHVEIPNHAAYNFNQNFTIEAIVYGANANVCTLPAIFSKRGTTGDGLSLGIANGKVYVSLGGTFYYDNSTSYNLYTSGSCNHIALTKKVVSGVPIYAVYVNGIATYTFASVFAPNTGNPIWIGNYNSANNVFNAFIDEIRIWNVAKAPSDIVANINTLFNNSTPNLIGYYRFKEESNAQWVKDESATNNYGFLGYSNSAIEANDPARGIVACYGNSRIAAEDPAVVPDYPAQSAADSVTAYALLYPNPFETTVRLKIVNLEITVTIQIVDAEGKLVYLKENHPATEELELGEDFTQGMYLIQFMDQPGLKPVKFIKAR